MNPATAAKRAKRSLLDPMCTCDNCGKRSRKNALDPIRDLDERLDYPPAHPSCIMPSGECPKCGALSYADEGFDSIQNADVFDAARMADLNDACYHLQKKAGLDSGDVAGVFFSGGVCTRWDEGDTLMRYTLLHEYLHTERIMAGEREE